MPPPAPMRPGTAPGQVVERGDLVEIGAVAGGNDLAPTQIERCQRLGEDSGVADIDQAGLELFGDMLELRDPGSAASRQPRSVPPAPRGMAGKREQRVIDAVARQDHDRPRSRQAALDEALGKRVTIARAALKVACATRGRLPARPETVRRGCARPQRGTCWRGLDRAPPKARSSGSASCRPARSRTQSEACHRRSGAAEPAQAFPTPGAVVWDVPAGSLDA